jgi:hypothetical protein
MTLLWLILFKIQSYAIIFIARNHFHKEYCINDILFLIIGKFFPQIKNKTVICFSALKINEILSKIFTTKKQMPVLLKIHGKNSQIIEKQLN